jgi:hypothetical protein
MAYNSYDLLRGRPAGPECDGIDNIVHIIAGTRCRFVPVPGKFCFSTSSDLRVVLVMTSMTRSARDAKTTSMPASLILRSTVVGERIRKAGVGTVPFERLLLLCCEKLVVDGIRGELLVQLELRVEGACSVTHENTILRVVDELLSNSMEHGFYGRQRGHVTVHVINRVAADEVAVSVSDDGWGFGGGRIIEGNGFHLLRSIGDLYYGAPAGPFVAKAAVTVVIPLSDARRSHFWHAAWPPAPL